jgi:hypothetical protein
MFREFSRADFRWNCNASIFIACFSAARPSAAVRKHFVYETLVTCYRQFSLLADYNDERANSSGFSRPFS